MRSRHPPYAREASERKLQPVATHPPVFVIADLHLGEDAICGEGRRPFRNGDEMDRDITGRWNATVRPEDTVYVLGDVGRRHRISSVHRLNGCKHLVAGNADNIDAAVRSGLFASVCVARWLPGFLLTHIPVHPSQLRGRTINVHGHLHAATLDDPRYRCVSVEQTNFAPVRLDRLMKHPSQGTLF